MTAFHTTWVHYKISLSAGTGIFACPCFLCRVILYAPALPLPNALSRFFHDSPAAMLHKPSGFEITLHTSFPPSVRDRGKCLPLFHHNCHGISTVQSHLKRGLIGLLTGINWTAIRHWSDGNQAPFSPLSVPDTKTTDHQVTVRGRIIFTSHDGFPWCSSVIFQQVMFTSSFNKWGSHHLSTSDVSPSFNIYLK